MDDMTIEELLDTVCVLGASVRQLRQEVARQYETIRIILEFLNGPQREWDAELKKQWIDALIQIYQTREGEKKSHRYINKELKRQADNIKGAINYIEGHDKPEGAVLDIK